MEEVMIFNSLFIQNNILANVILFFLPIVVLIVFFLLSVMKNSFSLLTILVYATIFICYTFIDGGSTNLNIYGSVLLILFFIDLMLIANIDSITKLFSNKTNNA